MSTAGVSATSGAAKTALGPFLRQNPFSWPLADGLFYRDKMRAIHRIAPERGVHDVLEIGGGQSGLASMLYPDAEITNLDMDPAFAAATMNQRSNIRFVTGDATNLEFGDDRFDVVTLFDLLEHVEDDAAVGAEAMRVVRPGGWVLVTTPQVDRWRYPYYPIFKPVCPSEKELFERWGHVRRGYRQEQLDAMFGAAADQVGGFINPLLALSHDVSFSNFPLPVRLGLHALVSPVSVVGWLQEGSSENGTEIAAAWRKPALA